MAQWVRDHEDGELAKIKQPVEPYDKDAAKLKEIR